MALVADAEGFHARRRQHKTTRLGKGGKVRRSPQAVAGRTRDGEELGRPQQLLPVENVGVWYTAPEARQGKPGHGTMLEPAHHGGPWGEGGGEVLATGTPARCGWGVVSSRGLGGGESPRHGAGLDGRTQPGKDTHPGHVGPDEYEPTSLRAIANRAGFCPARKRVQPRNRMREHCTSGSARGASGNRRPYRGGAAPVRMVEEEFTDRR